MFKKPLIALSLATSLCAVLTACGEEEVPPPPPKVEKPQVDKKSKFKKLESLSEKKEDKSKTNSLSNSKSTSDVTDLNSSDITQPGKYGRYVLQVGISPSKAQAKKIRNKLRDQGYKYTYLAEVEDPGELEGTFYRVRLGHFKNVPDARVFGSQVLKPMGISFWIDNKSNDAVGAPEQDEEYSEPASKEYYTESTSEIQEEEPYVEETQVATPEPAPEPAQEPETVVESATEQVEEKVEEVQEAAAQASEEDWDMPANNATEKAQEASSDWDDDGWN